MRRSAGAYWRSFVTRRRSHPSDLFVVCRQFHYFYLTDSGIEYLRQYLHLPAETVPNTHKKPARAAGAREERPFGGDRGERSERRPGGFGRGERGERSGGEGGYRRAAAAE